MLHKKLSHQPCSKILFLPGDDEGGTALQSPLQIDL